MQFFDPLTGQSVNVTTIFGGHCGFSIAPLSKEAAPYLLKMLSRVEGMPANSLAEGVPWDWETFGEYLGKLDGNLGVNAGFMAGHSAIRRVVMGARAVGEKATPAELEKMKALLAQNFDAVFVGTGAALGNFVQPGKRAFITSATGRMAAVKRMPSSRAATSTCSSGASRSSGARSRQSASDVRRILIAARVQISGSTSALSGSMWIWKCRLAIT